jgi:hypothetical protein
LARHDVVTWYPRCGISFGREIRTVRPGDAAEEAAHSDRQRKFEEAQEVQKAEPEPAPKQRCGRDAVLYERQLVITKIKAVAEKAHRQAKQAKDLMAILGSMKTEPKKQRSKLLRKVRRPPEHSSPRNQPGIHPWAVHGAQRAFDKVDRLLEQASAATCELGP